MSKIEVIGTYHYSTGQTNCKTGGVDLQITKCKLHGDLFYVREAINNIPSFYISSGERWSDKISGKVRNCRQALELLAPKHLWDSLAIEIHNLDPLDRPVTFNKRFTINWIRKTVNKEWIPVKEESKIPPLASE